MTPRDAKSKHLHHIRLQDGVQEEMVLQPLLRSDRLQDARGHLIVVQQVDEILARKKEKDS